MNHVRELSKQSREIMKTIAANFREYREIDARAEAAGLEWSRRLNRFVPIKARPARRVTA